DGSNVNLVWETANEVNNSHFTIERANDGRLFKQLDKVSGEGGGIYQFQDRDLQPGLYQYRIRQSDFDGAYTYSEMREVRVFETLPQLTVELFPNPWRTRFSLKIETRSIRPIQVRLLDIQGRILLSETTKEHHWTLKDSDKLSAGLYILSVKQGESQYSRLVQKLP
ncbi:MAG: T9SS type A sorting domain-containing protein, partial [Bacteroidota bacterium]